MNEKYFDISAVAFIYDASSTFSTGSTRITFLRNANKLHIRVILQSGASMRNVIPRGGGSLKGSEVDHLFHIIFK